MEFRPDGMCVGWVDAAVIVWIWQFRSGRFRGDDVLLENVGGGRLLLPGVGAQGRDRGLLVRHGWGPNQVMLD